MAKDGAAGDATVDIDKVKAYKDEELEEKKGEDRGDEVKDGEVEEKEEKEEKEEEKEEKEEEAEAKGEEEEGKEEEKEEKEDARDKKGRFIKSPMVPKARLDEALRGKAEADAALAELTQLIEKEFEEGEDEKDKEDPVKVLEGELAQLDLAHAKALKDGDEEKMAAIQGAIRQRERQISRLEATNLSEAARVRAREEIRADQVIDKLEALYPQLDPANKEAYDEELVAEVRLLRNGFVKVGMPLAEAVAKAVNYVMRGIEPKAAVKAEQKKAAGLKDKISAAKNQPGNLGKSSLGADHDKAGSDMKNIDVSKLSDSEFDKLPESTKARLRGDLG